METAVIGSVVQERPYLGEFIADQGVPQDVSGCNLGRVDSSPFPLLATIAAPGVVSAPARHRDSCPPANRACSGRRGCGRVPPRSCCGSRGRGCVPLPCSVPWVLLEDAAASVSVRGPAPRSGFRLLVHRELEEDEASFPLHVVVVEVELVM